MIWTAWPNGRSHQSGAGYGLTVSAADRDRHFDRSWGTVFIELPSSPHSVVAEANIDKDAFWTGTCRHLISKDIGSWMIQAGYAPWPKGAPPKFTVRVAGPRRFEVVAHHSDEY